MKAVLTNKNEITFAVQLLRQKIRSEFSETKNVEFGFPGGGQAFGTEYSAITSHGRLTIMIPDEKLWNQRIPHLVNLNPSDKKHAPDVELNIPLKLDKEDEWGHIFRCHFSLEKVLNWERLGSYDWG